MKGPAARGEARCPAELVLSLEATGDLAFRCGIANGHTGRHEGTIGDTDTPLFAWLNWYDRDVGRVVVTIDSPAAHRPIHTCATCGLILEPREQAAAAETPE